MIKMKEETAEVKVKRNLSLWDGVGIIVGIMIGPGIFVTPTGVLKYSGSVGLSLLVWTFTGLLTSIGAHCYTELGTLIPKSGGIYSYVLEGFGELPAFLYLWTVTMIIMPASYLICILAIANYLLQPLFYGCEDIPDSAVRLVAALTLGSVIWLNCFSTKAAVKVQDALSVSKVLALAIIGVIGAYYLATNPSESYQDSFRDSKWSFIALSTAYYQVFFTFGGWTSLNNITEELKNPERDLPRAIWIAIPMVTVVYLVANIAYFALLTPEEALSSNAVAVTFGIKVYDGVAWMISILVACSAYGSLNSSFISQTRIIFTGARRDHLPSFLGLINVNRSNPMAAIIFTALLVVILLFNTDIVSMIQYISFSENIFLWLSIVALPWLRYKRPDAPRPIKIWLGFPTIYAMFGLITIVLPIMEDPIGLGVTSGIILSGLPVYFLCIRCSKTKTRLSRVSAKVTKFVQILLLSCPETSNEEDWK